jgi:hypothetical protein
MSTDFAFPDEDTFEMPASWRRVLRRRRGGLPGTPVRIDPGAAEKVRLWTERSKERIAQALDDSHSDRELAEELRAHLAGRENPRGAAILAHLLASEDADDHSDVDDHGTFADAWVSGHGLSFAVRAAAELCVVEVDVWWPGTNRRLRQWRLSSRPGGGRIMWPCPWQPVVDRLRELLADVSEEDYRSAVAALAGHRRSGAQRIVASYLVPTETAWVDECVAEPPTGGYEHVALRTMLFCSIGSAAQADAMRIGLGFGQWSRGVLATLIDALGTDITPMIATVFHHPVITYADDCRVAAGVLSRLPTDEAFQLMVDHIDQKHVRPAVLEAMRRYPVRALRLLARTALSSSRSAPAAAELLAVHVRAEAELAAAALPRLPEPAREMVERILAEGGEAEDRVPDAPPGALPELLTEPPWTRRRKTASPVVVTGLEPPAESAVAWPAGRRDEWARSGTTYSHLREDDWDALVGRYKAGQLIYIWEIGLFLNGPLPLVRPLVSAWRPSPTYGAEVWMKAAIARYELDVLPLALDIVADGTPATCGELLLPFLDVRVARLMAGWLARLKSARRIATDWFAWHGAGTARLLVPDAVGPAGRARTNAATALRHLAAAGGADAVVAAAREYGEEAANVVESLLAADHLDDLPPRLPKVGDWLDPPALPQVLLRDREHALPRPAAGHVLTMLALPRPGGEPYAGLEVVREVCDPASLAEFGWEVFERWRAAGLPARDGWALTQLGWTGDDGTVRRLSPLIRAWPGEGGHQRAVAGLDVLAEIGTEIALLHLNDIAQRVKFKALKTRARQKIDEVAEGLGLTPEQLADRLVPDFGLDERGNLFLDYGPREFVVGFDEQLKPYVLDQDGKRRTSLPAPGARDDADLAAAARQRFTDLKKDVRTVAASLVRRLEAAMVTRRRWTMREFEQVLLRHPLSWQLARRLVWVAVADGMRLEFRVAEDRTLVNVADQELTPPAGARVEVAHPLSLGGTLDAWAEVFADYAILQPFPQLGRAVHRLTDEERTSRHLARFESLIVPTGRLLGLERRGWEREAPQDGGVQGQIFRASGDGYFVVIDLDPGIAVGDPDVFPEHRLASIWVNDRPDFYGRGENTPWFGDLDPVLASEVLADLTELTS